MGLCDKSEVNLNLPAFVNLCGAAMAAGGPGAVGDADKVSALNSCAVCCLELQDHGEQGRVNVPDGGKDEGDDGEAGDAPDDTHLNLQQPCG